MSGSHRRGVRQHLRARCAPTALAAGAILALQLAAGGAMPGLGSATGARPGGPSSGAIDQIQRSVTRPLPSVPPPAAPGRPERIWVPDQHLPSRDSGTVLMPGHWEYRYPTGEYQVPPLQACSPDGRCASTPGGETRLPPVQRQSP